jgi:hypothetical protein
MAIVEVVVFWVLLGVLAVAGFAGFLWATRPRTSMLEKHFADLERHRDRGGWWLKHFRLGSRIYDDDTREEWHEVTIVKLPWFGPRLYVEGAQLGTTPGWG